MPREVGLREELEGGGPGYERGPFAQICLHVSLSFRLYISLGHSMSLCLPVSVFPCLSRFSMFPDGLAHQHRGHRQPWKLQAVGGGLPDKI